MGDLENVLGPFGDAFDPEACQRNFDQLDTSGLDTGGRDLAIRFGVATISWPGATSLSTQFFGPHGLGRTPVIVVATVNTSGQGEVVSCHATAGLANVVIQAQWRAFSPSAGTTLPVSWLVAG